VGTTLEVRAPAEHTEGTRSQLLRWLKAVGDTITENEPLIELETDKVTVEVAAPASGILREIVKSEREEVEPGELLGRIELLDTPASRDARIEQPAFAAARERPPPARATAANFTDDRGSRASARSGHDAPPTDAATRLSPTVRRLLSERGIDPAAVCGSGDGGRITVDDVLAHVVEASPKAPTEALPQASAVSTDTRIHEVRKPSLTVPHSPIRRRIAEHMVRSLLHTAPHVTSVFEADMSAVIAHRARTRPDFERRGVPLTFTPYLLAAAIEAIRAVPEANSRWTDSALEIFTTVDIGIATALEAGGLVVPVLRNVQSLDLFDIARELDELVRAAREGRLQPADVRGGTFTISNHGVSGSLLAAPIVINQPQAAILGVGKVEKRPVVVEEHGEERIVARPKCYVTLTIDHRVMDGYQANRFLQVFTTALSAW
jgi:2-oxoglutarate dehydrogenase E2 component (dihydrolipoamide succinyltransferase)